MMIRTWDPKKCCKLTAFQHSEAEQFLENDLPLDAEHLENFLETSIMSGESGLFKRRKNGKRANSCKVKCSINSKEKRKRCRGTKMRKRMIKRELALQSEN
jgi:hypothetical protein